MSLPTVDIVTVNYNSTEYLEAYFAALRGLDYPNGRWRVVMVDNASTDGSLKRLPEWGHGAPLEICALPKNEGVTGGNNAGIRAGETVLGQTDRFVSDTECRGLYVPAPAARSQVA